MKHEHAFARLSDVAIFCKCGEVRYVAAPDYPVCTRPHYPTVYPTWIWRDPYYSPTLPWWIVTTGTASVSDNINYTLTTGTRS